MSVMERREVALSGHNFGCWFQRKLVDSLSLFNNLHGLVPATFDHLEELEQ